MRRQSTGKFTVTADHLKLLQRAYVGWDDCEYGAPAIDGKRPYGNGDVATDIAEILGWATPRDGPSEAQERAARALHEETATVLQIVLCTPGFAVTPGTYRITKDYDATSWERVS